MVQCEVLIDSGHTVEHGIGHSDREPTEVTNVSHTTANLKMTFSIDRLLMNVMYSYQITD